MPHLAFVLTLHEGVGGEGVCFGGDSGGGGGGDGGGGGSGGGGSGGGTRFKWPWQEFQFMFSIDALLVECQGSFQFMASVGVEIKTVDRQGGLPLNTFQESTGGSTE